MEDKRLIRALTRRRHSGLAEFRAHSGRRPAAWARRRRALASAGRPASKECNRALERLMGWRPAAAGRAEEAALGPKRARPAIHWPAGRREGRRSRLGRRASIVARRPAAGQLRRPGARAVGPLITIIFIVIISKRTRRGE